MKKGLIFCAFLISVFGTIAQNNSEVHVSEGPHIKFESVSHNFGNIQENTQVTHEFTFTNIGDKPLILTSVQPTCGCTASNYPRQPIKPGESASITATFNSRGYGGRSFSKSIIVKTNAESNAKGSIVSLNFSGHVVKKEAEEPKTASPVRVIE
jgi:hypothetical protein